MLLTWARRGALVAMGIGLTAAPVMAQGSADSGKKQIASPRDTARGAVAGANLMVDYGRPSMRGREIFGKLVPYDVVWRTGANAATTFVTNKDLVIGGTAVPAGTYTLYTLPSTSGWKLIVNKETGQWGTVYHQDKDLARIPMTATTLGTPVEKFLISIVPGEGNNGTIKLDWATTEASVGFSVK